MTAIEPRPLTPSFAEAAPDPALAFAGELALLTHRAGGADRDSGRHVLAASWEPGDVAAAAAGRLRVPCRTVEEEERQLSGVGSAGHESGEPLAGDVGRVELDVGAGLTFLGFDGEPGGAGAAAGVVPDSTPVARLAPSLVAEPSRQDGGAAAAVET